MAQPIKIGVAVCTNSFFPMEFTDQTAIELHKIGVKFLEIATEREYTAILYPQDPQKRGTDDDNFKRHYDDLKNLLDELEMETIATCSWNRESSAVTSDKEYIRKIAVGILYYMIDMARILDAKYMMTTFGTVRGPFLLSKEEIDRGIESGIQCWVDATHYAAISNEYGDALVGVECEQMSYPERDILSTFKEADYILDRITKLQEESGKPYVPFLIRHDVAHAPPYSNCEDERELTSKGWIERYYDRVRAFHLKCYIDEDGRPLTPISGEFIEDGRKITYRLLDAIERINYLLEENGKPQLEEAYVVYEGIPLKERPGLHEEYLRATMDSIKRVNEFFDDFGYNQDSETKLWIKR